MYCPKCRTENIDDANYCRLCGVRFQNEAAPIQPNSAPDLGRALKKLFIGIAFLIIAFVPLLEGEPITWWLLFPGVPMVMKGVRMLAQIKEAGGIQINHQASLISNPTTPIAARISRDVRARPTGELIPPPSVTENTTRLLEDGTPAMR